MATASRLPSLDGLLERYHKDTDFRAHAERNHDFWIWIHGGLDMVRQSRMSVDPVSDYWERTERRVLVSFFRRSFGKRYLPAQSLRGLAFQVFLHFDHARELGAFGDPTVVSVPSTRWARIIEAMIQYAASLPSLSDYIDLQDHWGGDLAAVSLNALLSDFLEEARSLESILSIEGSFAERLPWFPYLGLHDLNDLGRRQRFFYGLYLAMTSTNSYAVGGSVNFASVIQNNPSHLLLSYLERWEEEEIPTETGFFVEDKSEKKDRSDHATVKELYGFLNLHRMPFTNNATARAYAVLSESNDADDYAVLKSVGNHTRSWLLDEPTESDNLARLFRVLAGHPRARPRLEMEGIRRARLTQQFRKRRMSRSIEYSTRRYELQRSAWPLVCRMPTLRPRWHICSLRQRSMPSPAVLLRCRTPRSQRPSDRCLHPLLPGVDSHFRPRYDLLAMMHSATSKQGTTYCSPAGRGLGRPHWASSSVTRGTTTSMRSPL